jgi:RNA polymerase subunit RPABC4/transcription elongation factor Spt4
MSVIGIFRNPSLNLQSEIIHAIIFQAESIMTFDPTFMSSLILIATGFGAAFITALWLSLVIWTYRDIRQRTRDPLVRILAVLVSGVLFLPGVLIYLILRPSLTTDEEYQKTLEEEALLQSIEEMPLCPGCSRKIEREWRVCPNCHTKLMKPCPNCGRLMELPWNVCPYCATAVLGTRDDSPIIETPSVEDALKDFSRNDDLVDPNFKDQLDN